MTQELSVMVNINPADETFRTLLISNLAEIQVVPMTSESLCFSTSFPLTTSAFQTYGTILNRVNSIASTTTSEVNVEFLFPSCSWNRNNL